MSRGPFSRPGVSRSPLLHQPVELRFGSATVGVESVSAWVMREAGEMTEIPRFECIETVRHGGVAVLTLSRGKVNALDTQMLDEIDAFIQVCEKDPDIGALVVTGKGATFSAGLDVKKIGGSDSGYVSGLLISFEKALLGLFRCPMPTVAAVNGPAVAGGCLLACACDHRVIATDARIGVTELRVGVSIGVKTVDLLHQVCGRHAEELIIDARMVDAAEACRTGLAHHSRPSHDLLAGSIALARRLASLDPIAFALAKETSRRSSSGSSDERTRSLEMRSRDRWRSGASRDHLAGLM
jgi:enoyl-CoA hydratase